MIIDKTDTWFECWDDTETFVLQAFHWPYCEVDGCENRICRGVSDRFCHPHSGGRAANKLIEQCNQLTKATENA